MIINNHNGYFPNTGNRMIPCDKSPVVSADSIWCGDNVCNDINEYCNKAQLCVCHLGYYKETPESECIKSMVNHLKSSTNFVGLYNLSNRTYNNAGHHPQDMSKSNSKSNRRTDRFLSVSRQQIRAFC